MKPPSIKFLSLLFPMLAIAAMCARGAGATPEELVGQAQGAEAKGDYDGAIAIYQQALAAVPPAQRMAILNLLGNVYEEKGETGKALAEFNEAIKIDPKYARSYFNLGDMAFSRKDYDDVLKNLDKAIELKADFTMAYVERGNAWKMKGDPDKAIADFDRAVELQPDFAPVYLSLASAYYAKNDADKTIENATRAIALKPSYASAFRVRANAERDKGLQERAIADYTSAVQFNPKDGGSCNILAWMLATNADAKLRDGKKAVGYAQQACELSQWKTADAVKTLAVSYAEAGDFDNAVKYQQQFIAMPGISGQDATNAKTRLALFQAKTAYHAQQ